MKLRAGETCPYCKIKMNPHSGFAYYHFCTPMPSVFPVLNPGPISTQDVSTNKPNKPNYKERGK